MVEFRGVSKVYIRRAGGPVVHALADATFAVGPGDIVVLSGPTGSGKSTLLRLVAGEERASQGCVVVDGEDVATLGRRGLARLRRRLGIVPAEPRLLSDRTAFGNVALVLRALGASRRTARANGLAALREAGLAAKANAFPSELTVAERRRLCLARALAGGPRLLLADEPAAGLDEPAAQEVVDLLRRAHGQGATLLVATRAAGLAADLGARALTVEGGRVRAAGGLHGAA